MDSPQYLDLSTEDAQEIDTYFIYGLELLPIDHEQQTEEFVVLAIHMLLEAVRMGEPLPQGVSLEDFCTYLGVVYGEQICLRYGWEWKQVALSSYQGAGVRAPNENAVLFPIPAMYRWTRTENPNRCLTLYEEIKGLAQENSFRVLH